MAFKGNEDGTISNDGDELARLPKKKGQAQLKMFINDWRRKNGQQGTSNMPSREEVPFYLQPFIDQV
tara:strand:+ start:74 stop:274 length:201 start_codon:yes stop_codon:yes gene_type:complete